MKRGIRRLPALKGYGSEYDNHIFNLAHRMSADLTQAEQLSAYTEENTINLVRALAVALAFQSYYGKVPAREFERVLVLARDVFQNAESIA